MADINAVLTGGNNWEKSGLGKTGETYLVGADLLLRSSSRGFIEDKAAYLESLRKTRIRPETIALIDQLGTPILLQPVETDAARESLRGESATQIIRGYGGEEVLSSYKPLAIPGVTWAIVSEMSASEAFGRIRSLETQLIITCVLVVCAITAYAGFAAKRFLAPIDRMLARARNPEAAPDEPLENATNELGELARSFDDMANRLRKQSVENKRQDAEIEALLLSMLTRPAMERFRQGGGRNIDQIQQLTLVAMRIDGIESAIETHGAERVVDALNDWAALLEEKADRSEIERVNCFGDRYLYACGLSRPQIPHVRRGVDFAREAMRSFLETMRKAELPLRLRVGVQSGPATAAVVGKRLFHQDVWVNHPRLLGGLWTPLLPGGILVGEAVQSRVRDVFSFQPAELPASSSKPALPSLGHCGNGGIAPMSLLASGIEAQPSVLGLGLAFIIGLPLVFITLGEIIHRLPRAGNPLSRVLWAARTLVLPPLAAWIIAGYFFGVDADATALRLLQTLFWAAVALTLLLLLGILVSDGKPSRNWQVSMPNLLFQFLRALLVFAALTYLLAEVWKIDVKQIMGTLGIGSLVIALALQDTLSNLVSGFLLIIESPFKVGDWIKVGDTEGEVVEINWRAVRIKTIDRDVVVIPNGNLGKESIINFVLGDPLHAVRLTLPLSAADHPNLVRRTLMDVALSIEGILAEPEPEVDPQEFRNSSILYEVRFFITEYHMTEQISDEFLARAYYALRRAGISYPFPDRIEIRSEAQAPTASADQLLETLQAQTLFSQLDPASLQNLATGTRAEIFGAGESIVRVGHADLAFYIILRGEVALENAAGASVANLGEGDFLGETVLLPGEKSSVTASVRDTATVLRIEATAINSLVQKLPRFALEISQFIDERRKLIRAGGE